MNNDNLFARFIKDKDGNIVIWQWPNVPIIGWALFRLLSLIVNTGSIKHGLEAVSAAFLFTWAYLEITSGASYFRRLLGVLVMAALVYGYFN